MVVHVSPRVGHQLYPASVDAPIIDSQIQPDQVEAGDLVFCARSSFLQELCTRAGEPWRHVGIVAPVDGQLRVVEVTGPKFGYRTIDQVVSDNETVAVGRFDETKVADAINAAVWCTAHLEQEQVFAWDDTILAGFISTTRRFCLPQDQQALERIVTAATANLALRATPVGAHSYTCSAFILKAFLDNGSALEFDLSAPRGDDNRPSFWELVRGGQRPLRNAGGSIMQPRQMYYLVRALVSGVIAAGGPALMPASLDDQKWRWATPGDLWRSPCVSHRYYVEVQNP